MIDGCPECVLNTEPPRSSTLVVGAVRCAYLCSDCGHVWTTDWSATAVDVERDFPLATWENVPRAEAAPGVGASTPTEVPGPRSAPSCVRGSADRG